MTARSQSRWPLSYWGLSVSADKVASSFQKQSAQAAWHDLQVMLASDLARQAGVRSALGERRFVGFSADAPARGLRAGNTRRDVLASPATAGRPSESSLAHL